MRVGVGSAADVPVSASQGRAGAIENRGMDSFGCGQACTLPEHFTSMRRVFIASFQSVTIQSTSRYGSRVGPRHQRRLDAELLSESETKSSILHMRSVMVCTLPHACTVQTSVFVLTPC